MPDMAILVENGRIAEILTQHEWRASGRAAGGTPVAAPIVAPAFLDLQIYGAASRLLAVLPDAMTLFAMEQACRAGGTRYFLPTVATNPPEVFKKAIDAVRDYWDKGGTAIPGLHLEGPWINPVKKGAHIESFIHRPDLREVQDLLDYGRGAISIITLAPEMCDRAVIDLIQEAGIKVSAGHSNATWDQAEQFFRYIHLATHLFNAMSPLHHRAPGLPAAIMNGDPVRCSIVADGHHVDYPVIALAKKVMGPRLFLITDAVTETDTGPYRHHLVGDKYECNGILSGSALTMAKAVRNCRDYCGIPLDEALRMASRYPAEVLGREEITGTIHEGHRADLVLLNDRLEVLQTV